MNKCDQYIKNDNEETDITFSGQGPEWEMFFKHYYKIAHNNQKFTLDDNNLTSDLMSLSRNLLEKLYNLRPQTRMDGYKNVWIIKSKQSSNDRPVLLNKIEDILSTLTQLKGNNYIVQKYIETPLLHKTNKFDLQTWIVISTLDNHLTVWVYQTCCMQFRPNKYSLNTDKPASCVPSKNPNKFVAHLSVQTCSLKQLKGKLKLKGVKKIYNSSTIYAKIKAAVGSSVLAAADVLNLRPNCFELFQATFVVASDLQPWLIDIKSDPCPAHAFNWTMTSVASSMERNLAKIIVTKDRLSRNKIGMFEMVHKSAIPGDKFRPRSFVERPVTKKKFEKTKLKDHKTRSCILDEVDRWDDSQVSTYIERVQVKEIDDVSPNQIALLRNEDVEPTDVAELSEPDKPTRKNTSHKNTLDLNDLRESMARLKSGTEVNVFEAVHCLHLLDRWKKRVKSAQTFYKTIIAKNNA